MPSPNMGNVMARRSPIPHSISRRSSAFASLRIGTARTFEIGRENSLKVGRIHGAKRRCTEENLLQSVSRLPEMEQEEFHQSGFRICAEDLL